MPEKYQSPYSSLFRRLLKRILPNRIYHNYVARHEQGSISLWKSIATTVTPEKVILDIGAFHGKYAVVAKDANPMASVYCFEPNPATLKVLRPICEKKGIKVEAIAIADQNGTIPFLCATQQSRILAAHHALNEKVRSVSTETLDSWTKKNAVVPDLIRIDVEGAEARVLRGAQKVLVDYQPIIFCEVLTNSSGNNVMAALPSTYYFYYIDENFASVKKQTRITRRCWRNKDWLLIPEKKLIKIASNKSIQLT